MKKMYRSLAVLLAVCCVLGVAAFASGESSAEVVEEQVDAYSTASLSRTVVVDDDFMTALTALMEIDSDLATAAAAAAEGYEEPANAVYAQVMSVNDEGSVSLSTIHAWMVEYDEELDEATVTIVMTYGQTISNLLEEGDRATILVHGEMYYLLHVETESVIALEYSDEAYEAGAFNVDYSGSENALTEYTVTLRIYALETTWAYLFD